MSSPVPLHNVDLRIMKQIFLESGWYGGLNRYGLRSFMCLSAWAIGSSTIMRYGFDGAGVVLLEVCHRGDGF